MISEIPGKYMLKSQVKQVKYLSKSTDTHFKYDSKSTHFQFYLGKRKIFFFSVPCFWIMAILILNIN